MKQRGVQMLIQIQKVLLQASETDETPEVSFNCFSGLVQYLSATKWSETIYGGYKYFTVAEV